MGLINTKKAKMETAKKIEDSYNQGKIDVSHREFVKKPANYVEQTRESKPFNKPFKKKH